MIQTPEHFFRAVCNTHTHGHDMTYLHSTTAAVLHTPLQLDFFLCFCSALLFPFACLIRLSVGNRSHLIPEDRHARWRDHARIAGALGTSVVAAYPEMACFEKGHMVCMVWYGMVLYVMYHKHLLLPWSPASRETETGHRMWLSIFLTGVGGCLFLGEGGLNDGRTGDSSRRLTWD